LADTELAPLVSIDTVVDERKADIGGQYIIVSLAKAPFTGPRNDGGAVVFDFPGANNAGMDALSKMQCEQFPRGMMPDGVTRASYADRHRAIWAHLVRPHVRAFLGVTP
jgi:hypothetical protein